MRLGDPHSGRTGGPNTPATVPPMTAHPRVTRETFTGKRPDTPPVEIRRALAIALVALNALSMIAATFLITRLLLV